MKNAFPVVNTVSDGFLAPRGGPYHKKEVFLLYDSSPPLALCGKASKGGDNRKKNAFHVVKTSLGAWTPTSQRFSCGKTQPPGAVMPPRGGPYHKKNIFLLVKTSEGVETPR